MKSLNLQRILTLITTCSLLAAMVVRTAPCGAEKCPMQAAEMKKSGCCSSLATTRGMLPQDGTSPVLTVIPDFTFAKLTGTGSNCHGSGIILVATSPGTTDKANQAATGQTDQSDQSNQADLPVQTDQSESAPRSGCDNCDCEIRSSSDTEARTEIAVPAPDLTLAGPALTGETARKPSAPLFISHFTKRAPPHPGVPAYILNASLLN
jgi:hypothetical protein